MNESGLSASIVLYQHDEKAIKAIESLLHISAPIRLFLVDNSPDDRFIKNHPGLKEDERISYIFNNKNLGYGNAHNIAMRKAIGFSDYHVVLNPDVEFDNEALQACIRFMEMHKNIGLLMPKILYPDGSTQYLCKMLPSPFDLIMRRFIPDALQSFFQKRLDQYELKHKSYDEVMEVPNLSGCFMMLRCEALKTVGLFDDRFFMYLEDTDLSRRINQQYQTIYYPKVHIIHHYEKGSYKNMKLLVYHIRSAFRYFGKWGWVLDPGRKTINTLLK